MLSGPLFHSARAVRRGVRHSGLALLALAATHAPATAKETKAWAVSWFTVATYSDPADCVGGLNPSSTEVWANGMRALGVPEDQIKAYFDGTASNELKGKLAGDFIRNRGRIDGQPVNVYANPLAREYMKEPPKFNTTSSKYGFGFDLDGKGDSSPNGFEDPFTHERGLDNEFYRVMSCMLPYQAKPPARPASGATNFGGGLMWAHLRTTMPAWLVIISGDDLSKDGKVTVTFTGSIDPMHTDSLEEPLSGDTFRLDPDPRAVNTFKGTLKNGVVTVEPTKAFQMMGDSFFLPEFKLRDVHLRLAMKEDGKLEGLLGGYQEWNDIYWGTANTGMSAEVTNAMDSATLYTMLQKHADGYPDPKTRQNTHISIAWRVEAIPAFVVPADNTSAPARR